MNGRRWLWLMILLANARLLAQMPTGKEGAPAENWEMKIFSKEGYRSMILRGTEVRLGTTNRYDVTDLSITVFSGGSEARIDSILLSPVANFYAKENRASGEQTMRLIRDDMEITGERWTYVHTQRKVTIQQNTRVVFHAALPDLLR